MTYIPNRPLIVNLFAGPGAGKSTTAALVFGQLKLRGFSVELVTEVAKDLTWEGAYNRRAFAPLLLAEQAWRIARVVNQVDVVVTDSPLLMQLAYADHYAGFEALAMDLHRRFGDDLNYVIERTPSHPYVRCGRTETEEEARLLDERICRLLDRLGVPYERGLVTGQEAVDRIVSRVEELTEEPRSGK